MSRIVLKEQIALTEPGLLAGLRRTFSFLPLVPEVGDHPFDPAELQRDKIRLARYYQNAGFLETDVQYEVRLDTTSNTVDIRFLIAEGRPVALEGMDFVLRFESSPEDSLPAELAEPWNRMLTSLRNQWLGQRFGLVQRQQLQDRVLAWLRDQGFPAPRATSVVSVDSMNATTRLAFEIEPGSRKRVSEIGIEGNRALSDAVLRREFPLRSGDWFSGSKLAEGERELFGLDMVRWANATTTATGDTTATEPLEDDRTGIPIRVQVEEGPLRLISGRAGYTSSAGMTLEADWSHRNFLGGGRVLKVSTEGRTGFLAADETFERRYGVAVSIRQPFLWHRRTSGILTPFFEYRDGAIDESRRNGIDATVVHEFGRLNTVSIGYAISAREILEYRFGTLTDSGTDFLALQTILDDSLGVIRESRFTASATWGQLDDRVSPTEGLVSRTALQFAGPDALSRVEFAKVTASLHGFYPLGPDLLARGRVFAGRVYPYGKSVPQSADDDGLIRFLELRDALLSAGGTGDVRGWADGLLGPKVPDFRIIDSGDAFVTRADRYIPIGGFARMGFSAELAAPLPGSARRHSLFGFIDGGRVWQADSRFGLEDDFDEQRFFFGTGLGLGFATPIGPVRVAIGYKLNPSVLDVRDPQAVQQALEAGLPVTSVSTQSSRRFRLHIDLGRVF